MANTLMEAFVDIGVRDQKLAAGLKAVEQKVGGTMRTIASQVSRGFFQGLGIGTADQMISGLTRSIANLTSEMGRAVIQGGSLADTFDRWATSLPGVGGMLGAPVADMFGRIEAGNRMVAQLGKQSERQLRGMSGKDVPGQGFLDTLEDQRSDLHRRATVLQGQIAKIESDELGRFGKAIEKLDANNPVGRWLGDRTRDLKFELTSVLGDIEELAVIGDAFAGKARAADAAKNRANKPGGSSLGGGRQEGHFTDLAGMYRETQLSMLRTGTYDPERDKLIQQAADGNKLAQRQLDVMEMILRKDEAARFR